MQPRYLLFGASTLAALAAGAQQRPNIIYIMCDDMGYGDLSCYGQQLISTPNIDRLAQQGMRFTQAYAGSPVSAPSRASFMTGQHTGHTHVRGNKEYWSNNNTMKYGNNTDYALVGQEPYDTAHVIIPEIFKDNGYTTGMFGKWLAATKVLFLRPISAALMSFMATSASFKHISTIPTSSIPTAVRRATRP